MTDCYMLDKELMEDVKRVLTERGADKAAAVLIGIEVVLLNKMSTFLMPFMNIVTFLLKKHSYLSTFMVCNCVILNRNFFHSLGAI